ncbi:putative loganate O-methyltransferase [Rosa chinensis]|uniref:Putative loganate O-methyltransferase n=2 Tax=Rosa chinensis TaxID=74649 RepID=A0A2P6P208_ROSCH|nr:loganic acid O-methyltransferase isoform X1 [Rosa chinensis]PRQ15955.1 putative loganate O-methyltransferase [Rosa chinensis]
MAADDTSNVFEAHPMEGGDGPNSYAKNSIVQRGVVDAAKELVKRAIVETLNIDILSSSNSFKIADLGCSVGPNTFYAVENMIEAVEFKYQSQGQNSQIPEFQVLFNDHASNDFNMLFISFPENKRYYAAGVPGSFYSRVFPNASIHLVHSSYAIHWLSRVPKEVLDKHSPAWNKGKIHYLNARDEVVRAYEAQYVEDMECFLHARAQEIVYGGLMVLIFPGRPNGSASSQAWANMSFQVLGSCLMDLVRKGVISEEKVDSSNMPIYSMTPQELEDAVKQNGCFSVEIMANLPHPLVDDTLSVPQLLASHLRTGVEGMVKKQFGEEILDELFDLYREKCEHDALNFLAVLGHNFIVVLRRKAD